MKRLIPLCIAAAALTGCAQVKSWLANGPEMKLEVGFGPAHAGVTLNPGKTVTDVAGAVTDAVSGVVTAETAAVEPAK